MNILLKLSTVAVHSLADGAGAGLAVAATGEVVGFLKERFSDHSQRLTLALTQANERAWQALEVSLAGASWWQRVTTTLARAEDQAFRQQVRAFLDAHPHPELKDGDQYRQQALQQLRAARKAGHLGGALEPDRLAEQVGGFARFAEPTRVLDAEWQAMTELADDLETQGHAWLAWLLKQRPEQGPPLLVTAVRYFFRRAVEEDRALFQGLAFAQLEKLSAEQERGFDGLASVLRQQGQRLTELLEDVQAVVVESQGHLLDIKAEQQQHGQRLGAMYDLLHQLTDQYQLQRRALRSGDSLSIRSDGERRLVKQLVAQYRALPEEQQRRLPATLNAIGKLEVVAGEFDSAQKDFQKVATLVDDGAGRAEAHHNAYRAALEKRDWTTALSELLGAVRRAPGLTPFPMDKFLPQRILGAGGFGVAFLCKHRYMEAPVVVKSLTLDGSDRDADQVFSEAHLLRQIDHPAIIRTIDCGYVDGASKTHPFLVMDYFEGVTLEEHVKTHGPLSADDLLALARPVAEGLQAAHGQNILHRDVKPANLLVRREPGAWQVKLIDFGLALDQQALQASADGSTPRPSRTLAGTSIAGTVEYAAPEQMGRRSEPVGAAADVYSFAKTCCYALFRTTQPVLKHWHSLPTALAEVLSRCLDEDPRNRPQSFAEVIAALDLRQTIPLVRRPEPPAPPHRPTAVSPPVAVLCAEPGPPDRQAVQALVSAPAVGLIVCGVVGALFNGFAVLYCIFGMIVGGLPDLKGPQLIVGCLTFFVGAVVSGVTALGGKSMLRLNNYPLALTGSVLATVGLCLCSAFGLPIGIWALLVLKRPAVKAAFQ